MTEEQKYALHLQFWAELSRQSAQAFADRGMLADAFRAGRTARRFSRRLMRVAS